MSLLTRVLGALEDEPLSTTQRNFMALHVKHAVDRWQWHFCSTQLRAHAGRRSATIWYGELDDLVQRGLMLRSHGATVSVTLAGREWVK